MINSALFENHISRAHLFTPVQTCGPYELKQMSRTNEPFVVGGDFTLLGVDALVCVFSFTFNSAEEIRCQSFLTEHTCVLCVLGLGNCVPWLLEEVSPASAAQCLSSASVWSSYCLTSRDGILGLCGIKDSD